ncbi:MAG: ComF family protein [Verrucomicrobiota bacterium]
MEVPPARPIPAARRWLQGLSALAFPPAKLRGLPPKAVPPARALRGTDPIPGQPLTTRGVARPWSFAWAHGQYEAMGQVRRAVIDFKFNGGYHQRPRLVQWLRDGFDLMAAAEEWDALVPVPLHFWRLRQRGFNQAAELARGLGEEIDLPVRAALKRTVATKQQTTLTRAQRWDNTRRAFALRRGQDVDSQRLILIDDVLTTGATTEACARALKKAGAGEVAVLCVARG